MNSLPVRSIVPLKILNFLSFSEGKFVFGGLLANRNGQVVESFEICNDVEKMSDLLDKKLELLHQIYPDLQYCGIYSNKLIHDSFKLPMHTSYFVHIDDSAIFNWYRFVNASFEQIPIEKVSYFNAEVDAVCMSQCILSTGACFQSAKERALAEIFTYSQEQLQSLNELLDKKRSELEGNQIDESQKIFTELQEKSLKLFSYFESCIPQNAAMQSDDFLVMNDN